MIDVRDYGVVGSGDESTQVAAALAATPSGDTLLFPAGDFTIGAVSRSTPLRVLGAGGLSGQTILRGSLSFGASGPSAVERVRMIGTGTGTGIAGTKDVNLDDVWISGYGDNISIGSQAYYTHLRNVFSQGATNAGILGASGIHNLTLSDVRLYGNAIGFKASAFTSVRFFGGSVEQNTTYGIYAGGASKSLLIEGTYFESAVGSAQLYLAPSGVLDRAVLVGALFADGGAGWAIDAYGVNGLTIIGGYVGGPSSLRASATGTPICVTNSQLAGTIASLRSIWRTDGGAATAGQGDAADASLTWLGNRTWKSSPLWVADGLRVPTAAGPPVDASFPGTIIGDGLLAVDSSARRLYVRLDGVWRSVALT